MSERTVVSQAVDETRSSTQLAQSFSAEGDKALAPKAIQFELAEYDSFRVEYALVDGDFVVHFFITKRQMELRDIHELEHWWLEDFAEHADLVAQEYFNATKPRLMMKYTREVASWWLRARGYGHLIDPLAFLRAFFERLDDSFPEYRSPPSASQEAMEPG